MSFAVQKYILNMDSCMLQGYESETEGVFLELKYLYGTDKINHGAHPCSVCSISMQQSILLRMYTTKYAMYTVLTNPCAYFNRYILV